jgi:hypothetical protein
MASRKNGRKKNGTRQVDLDKVFADGTAIDRAMRAGIADAIMEHKRRGLPIAEWSFEEDRVVWTPADEIADPRAKKKRATKRRAS